MIYDNPTRAAAFVSGPFKDLCTPAEMAEYLHIDDSTIRQAIRSGRLAVGKDCLRLGKQWVLSRHAWRSMCGDYEKFAVLQIDCVDSCVGCRKAITSTAES